MEENKKTYSEDHVLAMFEEIKGQGKIAIELYSSLSEKFDLVLEDIDELKSDNVDMKRDIKEIKEELVGMNMKLDNKAEKTVIEDHEDRLLKLEKSAVAAG